MLKFSELKEPYFIAEIGINHNGDIQIAKKLIDTAYACGWNCVKFQRRDPDICVPEDQKGVLRDTPWGRITYLEYKKKIEFDKQGYDVINSYCKLKPIEWAASVWDLVSLDFIIHYNPPFIKIPSAHMTNFLLVEKAAKSGIPLIVSTGMSTLEEVDRCVDILKKYNIDFALMHTNSAYPSPDDEINLNIIKTFIDRYGCIVGYSGHEYGVEASVVAVVLGARIIERHITLDHDMWGTDQKASLEIDGMDKLIRRAKHVGRVLGSSEKKIMNSEIEVRKKLRGY
ncbi:MAG: N-acetylneuraminate synthase [Thermodesulfovibrio sp.]|nr:N-acetylneuraminate synthase [Thermodesulfovibrio sp.]